MIKSTFMLLLCPVFLSIGTVLTKLMVLDIPAFFMLSIQLFGSLNLLCLVVLLSGAKIIFNESIKSLLLIGVVIGIGSVFTILSLKLIPANQAAMIFASQPLIIFLLSWLFLQEKVEKIIIFFGLLAVAGVFISLSNNNLERASSLIIGSLFAFVSTLAAAVYSVWMKKISLLQEPIVSLIIIQLVSLVISVTLAFYFESPVEMIFSLSFVDIFKIYLIGMIYYGLAFLSYLLGLRKIKSSIAGIYLNLIPVFTIALSFFVLGETLNKYQWVGMFFTLSSLVFISVFVVTKERLIVNDL